MVHLNDVQKTLLNVGICELEPIFAPAEIDRLNAAVDGPLRERASEHRSYVKIDEMHRLGLIDLIFSDRMRNVIFSVIPDAVLYHCHIYEIVANSDRPHIFGESLAGFHFDLDSAYHRRDASHISIFVYLTEVGPENGAFEFIPQRPTRWLSAGTQVATMTGAPGFSFIWNRAYYHRASPNRSGLRRRLLKLSIQSNRLKSSHIASAPFARLREEGVGENDPELGLLTGRYQGKPPPSIAPRQCLDIRPVKGGRSLDLSPVELNKFNLKTAVARTRQSLWRADVAYD